MRDFQIGLQEVFIDRFKSARLLQQKAELTKTFVSIILIVSVRQYNEIGERNTIKTKATLKKMKADRTVKYNSWSWVSKELYSVYKIDSRTEMKRWVKSFKKLALEAMRNSSYDAGVVVNR